MGYGSSNLDAELETTSLVPGTGKQAFWGKHGRTIAAVLGVTTLALGVSTLSLAAKSAQVETAYTHLAVEHGRMAVPNGKELTAGSVHAMGYGAKMASQFPAPAYSMVSAGGFHRPKSHVRAHGKVHPMANDGTLTNQLTWSVLEVRGVTQGMDCNKPDCMVEIPEMIFYGPDGSAYDPSNCTVTGVGVDQVDKFNIEKAYDGDSYTVFKHDNTHGTMEIIFTWDHKISISGFAFNTAKDYKTRDPSSWIMTDSDGNIVHEATAFVGPEARNVPTTTFDLEDIVYDEQPAMVDDESEESDFALMPQQMQSMCATRYDPSNLPNSYNVPNMADCEDGCMGDVDCKGIEWWADTVNMPSTPFCFYCSEVEDIRSYNSQSDAVYPPIVKARGVAPSHINDEAPGCEITYDHMCHTRYGPGWGPENESRETCRQFCAEDAACVAYEYWEDDPNLGNPAVYSAGPACFKCSSMTPMTPYNNEGDLVYPPTVTAISC